MLITAADPQQPKPSKIILSTNQAYQISQLIKEYIEAVFEQPGTTAATTTAAIPNNQHGVIESSQRVGISV